VTRRAAIIACWGCVLAIAAILVARAHYITDLSAFLPARPTPAQRLLVDQLREGPASRLILVALEGADPALRAGLSRTLARRLRADPQFLTIGNGETEFLETDRTLLFEHRYLLSDAVTAEHFTRAGLARAIGRTIEDLASPAGMFLKPLVARDPTGEMLHILDELAATAAPAMRDGVWMSAGGERTLLAAQTAAAGSDTDGQERAQGAIRAAFQAAVRADANPAAPRVRLTMSGPGVFAVTARAHIKQAAMRLSIVSSCLVVLLLLSVYRSIPALLLGLTPVATGALIGIAAVALGFGAVHGITLGFGITLIGESVDYSIYFFIQSRAATHGSDPTWWRRRLWPTVRLGLLTSVCGFASLLPSGFPGLAQLGAYSISGLIAAAAVTRFVLPELVPAGFVVRDLTPLGARWARRLEAIRRGARAGLWATALGIAVIALAVLVGKRERLWDKELSSLSPVPAADLRYDALLRADLGAANVLDLVVISGPDEESVLRGAEQVAPVLRSLIDAHVIGGFDSPANFLPSLATQRARQASLPEAAALRENLRGATADLPLSSDRLAPFLADVEAARHGALLAPQALAGSSLSAGLRALILAGGDHFSAILPLHAADPAAPDIDVARGADALAAANLPNTQLLDLKRESDALYADYLHEAIRLSLAGLVLIVVLLAITLRASGRVARVLAPLVLAVLVVAATLAACGVQLTILHLVGMLLIVAVGSNYALFFDAHRRTGDEAGAPLMLSSLLVANLCTVIGFGLLSFSKVPVLEALGLTVAPGAWLALVFSALLTPAPAGA
jgi:predicted exporter